MNRAQPPTTRRETTYTDVGNADIASLHGCNLLGQRRSCCRGAYICRSCTLGCRSDHHGWWKCRFCICPWMDSSRAMQELLPRSKKPAMRHTVSGDGSHSMLLSVNGAAVIKSTHFQGLAAKHYLIPRISRMVCHPYFIVAGPGERVGLSIL